MSSASREYLSRASRAVACSISILREKAVAVSAARSLRYCARSSFRRHAGGNGVEVDGCHVGLLSQLSQRGETQEHVTSGAHPTIKARALNVRTCS